AVAVAGGVAFGTYAYRRTPENPLLADLPEGGAALTPFVLLDADGVTLITPRADVGQGATSVQTYLLAEELDVDPMTVRTSPGPASPVYYNGKLAAEGMPLAAWDTGLLARTGRAASDVAGKLLGLHGTGGSTTVPDMYDRLREAGAAARETLKAAAAARLGVAADSLRTEAGAVVPPDGAPIPYAALIPDLARVEVVQDVPLRAPEDWRWLGREMQRTDIVAKSTGTFRYGTDLVLPEMVHATVRTNPARGGGVVQMDDAAARAQPGVIDILEIEDGVAVVADNTWRAIKAANLIDVTWGTPEGVGDSAAMWAAHGAAFTADKQDSRFADDGDVDAAPGTPLEAEYRVPYLHHAPLEPANATVRFTPEATEVWAATQIPTMVVDQIADVTGQSADQITLHALPAGGSFGHRLEFEWIVQATQIAMHVPGRPVRLTLSREQDMTHGFLRPMAMARGRGTVEGGQVRAFDLSIAAQSVSASQMGRMGFPAAGPDVAIVAAAWDAPYAVPDRRVTGYRVDPMVGVSSWRAVGASHNGFFH
ncbi:MAG: xanthine dehydrogenase family protein, partial [Pseudomonadota bacterium]